MTKVRWLSDADNSDEKWKDIEDGLVRQSNYYIASVFIKNRDNKRTLDAWKTDDELLELLKNLQAFAPVEIEIHEDHRHESFNVLVCFDNKEDCKSCAAVHSRGGVYGSPSTHIGLHKVEFVKSDR